MGPVALPGNKKGHFKDWGPRCLHCPRQPLDAALERQTVLLAEVLPPNDPTLGLRLPGVLRGLQTAGDGGHSIPHASQWAINRQSTRISHTPGRALSEASGKRTKAWCATRKVPGWPKAGSPCRTTFEHTRSGASKTLGQSCSGTRRPEVLSQPGPEQEVRDGPYFPGMVVSLKPSKP